MDNYNPMLVRLLKACQAPRSITGNLRDLELRIDARRRLGRVQDTDGCEQAPCLTLPSEVYHQWASVASVYNVIDRNTPRQFRAAVSGIARNLSDDSDEAGRAFNILGKAMLCVDVNGEHASLAERDYLLITYIVDLAQALAKAASRTPRPSFARFQTAATTAIKSEFTTPRKGIETITYTLAH